MVTAASPFFACMQLRDKRYCWRFEKTFALWKKLLFWPTKISLTFILRCEVCTHFLSLCLVFRGGSERFGSARFQLRSTRQRGLQVYLSTDRTLSWRVCWKVFQWPGEFEMKRRKLQTLWFRRSVRILDLPGDFSLGHLLAKFSVCHRLQEKVCNLIQRHSFGVKCFALQARSLCFGGLILRDWSWLDTGFGQLFNLQQFFGPPHRTLYGLTGFFV